MSSESSLCPTCWAEGQRPGQTCWLCHSMAKQVAPAGRTGKAFSQPPLSTEAVKAEPFVATAVDAIPMDGIEIDSSPNNPYAAPNVVEDTGAYRLSSALLAGMLVLICVVLSIAAPGLGIPVSVILLPALIRTAILSNHDRAQGKPQTFLATLSMFFFSAAAAVAAAISAALACIAAFLSACLVFCFGSQVNPVDFNGNVFNIVIGISVLCAIGVGIFLFLQLTKRTNTR